MAKRKLSQHQKARIDKAQQVANASTTGIQAQVISHHGGKLLIEDEQGQRLEASIKSNLGAIVSGDFVVVETDDKFANRVISVKPRKSLLRRQDGFGHLKYVAANITQMIICCAVKPVPNLLLLDQYILSAEQQNIESLIVLNKSDLLPPDSIDPFCLKSIYEPLEYKVLTLSVKSGEGLDTLNQCLKDQQSLIGGVSGVGKSSIIQFILPDEDIRIGAISEANSEGKHTTRTSRLYRLAAGGDLIDTPGVRGFTPEIDPDIPVSWGFREISNYAQLCKFANCRHLNEPACAVVDAVSSGQIASSRYHNYLAFSGLKT
ncbi:MAG: ribosome biogenesis GTPase [Gammaproteobacteria bacterium]|jgi:ribosome biogenesis GTPase